MATAEDVQAPLGSWLINWGVSPYQGPLSPPLGTTIRPSRIRVTCPQDVREMHVATDLPLGLGFPPRASRLVQ